MSQLLDRSEYDDGSFELGDRVSFLHPGSTDYRLTGTVVRVYNSRLVYHVEVDGERYSVRIDGGNQDDVQRA